MTKFMPITTDAYLYLSGTPFRALASGEFIEEQIFNWTYSDEQRAKQEWEGEDNPYASLPRMVLLTYQLPDSIREIAMQGEFNEFDLNVFFSAEGSREKAKFKYQDEVQKWLDLIRGSFLETTIDNLKLGARKPPMPFSDIRLLNVLSHTFWFLPSVASCHAMRNLLATEAEQILSRLPSDRRGCRCRWDWCDGIATGTERQWMNPLKTKTITLSCGKLTTRGYGQTVDRHSHAAQFIQSLRLIFRPHSACNPPGHQKSGQHPRRTRSRLSKRNAMFLTSRRIEPYGK